MAIKPVSGFGWIETSFKDKSLDIKSSIKPVSGFGWIETKKIFHNKVLMFWLLNPYLASAGLKLSDNAY